MTIIIGIVGKPSSGKSTFLNAACLTNAKVSELPFTTIEPNKGIGYVRIDCVCREFNLKDNPKNSFCINGIRFIPINLLDVAGLVPDAHKGKGLGNKFLNDLSKADVLLHIVDITGSLDKTGKRVKEGQNDPYEDILFLEKEINLWFKEILERRDWSRFIKAFKSDRKKFIEELYNRLSGIKITKNQIITALKNSNLESKNPAEWTDNDLYIFAKTLREISKPILIIANKIDKEIGLQKFNELQKKYNKKIIPCSALAEYYLRKFHEENIIEYIPGDNDFKILKKDKLKSIELKTLEKIKEKIMNVFNGTGVQKAINYAVFKILNLICVYPVYDVNNFTDKSNNVLPDVYLIKKGTYLKEFIREYIHSDLAKHFIFGIDARTKKRLGEKYELQHNDIIKVVSAK
ncbi:MAG: redox-regulated ATPase YchF [Promethearchaeia archaeon]